MPMLAKLAALRKKHPRFVYENFVIKKTDGDLKITFKFKIEPDIYFKPEIIIENIRQSKINALDKGVISNLAFNLGLMEIPSYWKVTCSPEIVIKAGFLVKKQVAWWQDLLLKGLGQFFYTNKINFTKPEFINFKIKAQDDQWDRYEGPPSQENFLVLVGGGKDSAVTLETIKNKGKVGCLLLNPQKAALKVANLSKPSSILIVRRKIDPKLIELNQKGYLNGHTPFSAYLSFLSATMAVLFGFGSIVASNERSAEEENLTYLGRKINHQYSKAFRFEKLFNQYAKQYLAKNLHYFSLLRPLWEIQIAKLFSKHDQYFPIFRSCNVGQKTNSWCKRCSKCLSVFILLYPFLKKSQILKIFGGNLFDDKNLLPVLKALIGKSGHKPFECVATYKESLAALYLSLKKEQKKTKLPFLLDFFQSEILPRRNDWEKITKSLLTDWTEKHLIPQRLAKLLKRKIRDEN